jgi:hypothetical protein
VELPPEPVDVRYTARFVADAGTGNRLATSLMRYRMTRPQVLIGWPVIVAALLIWGISQDSVVGALLTGLVLVPVVALLMFRQVRVALRKLYPSGSVHTTAFGSRSMTVTGPFHSAEIDYELFAQVWVDPTVVLLRQWPTKSVSVMPVELFPEGALALVRAGFVAPGQRRQH